MRPAPPPELRHAVALDGIHEAFVGGPMQHWAASADVLAMQRRVSAGDAQRVRLWRAFGRLLGNSDMHFGNLSLWADEPASGALLRHAVDELPARPAAQRLRPNADRTRHPDAA